VENLRLKGVGQPGILNAVKDLSATVNWERSFAALRMTWFSEWTMAHNQRKILILAPMGPLPRDGPL
jgi:hypothetical protein